MENFCKILMLPNDVQFLIVRTVSDNKKFSINFFVPPPPRLVNKLPPVLLYKNEYQSKKERDLIFDNFDVKAAIDFMTDQDKNMKTNTTIIMPKVTC